MPVPPNPYPPHNNPPFYLYKFEVGDIIRILPSSGKWASPELASGRDYSECEITDRYVPCNGYGCGLDGRGGEPMAAYNVKSIRDGSPGTCWEVDIELIRKKPEPTPKQRKYRSIDDE
jgi:hypothetical protein